MTNIALTPEIRTVPHPVQLRPFELAALGSSLVSIPSVMAALTVVATYDFPVGTGRPNIPIFNFANGFLIAAPSFAVMVCLIVHPALGRFERPELDTSTGVGRVLAAIAVLAIASLAFGSSILVVAQLLFGFITMGSQIFLLTLLASSFAAFLCAKAIRRLQEGIYSTDDCEQSPPNFTLLLPALLLPISLAIGGLPTLIALFVLPGSSLVFFLMAFYSAHRARRTQELAVMRFAGRCLTICAVELSLIAGILGMSSVC